MFTIIISEKGGAERRETFERNEINVGRVQGNDLMLPKGNVSKHHARLLLRDGRFIVTDLRSTNGTYVNGRKISQATIVREGDKIYIGDFVLRLETAPPAGAADAVAGHAAANDEPQSRLAARPASWPRDAVPPARESSPSAPGSPHRPAEPSSVSHYPLERDPDSESAPEAAGTTVPKVPGPPRLPQSADVRARSTAALHGHDRSAPVVQRERGPAAAVAVAPVRALPPPPAAASPLPIESVEQADRRRALIALVARVAAAMDLAPLERAPEPDEALSQQVDRVLRDHAAAMTGGGEWPEGVDVEGVVADARRELLGAGPLGPLLEDDDVSEVHVLRPDYVLVVRRGHYALAEPGFSSEKGVARAVFRLAHASGEPLGAGGPAVERRLARGARMVAIGPPIAADGWVLALRKRRRVGGSLEELVRAGAISRSIATFL